MGLIDEMLANERIEDRIWELHNKGLAPSQIAHELRIPAYEARQEVVARWAADKAKGGKR